MAQRDKSIKKYTSENNKTAFSATFKMELLAKLMDESEQIATPLLNGFVKLEKSIIEELPEILDTTGVKNASDVLRRCEDVLDRQRILNVLPSLATSSIVAICGKTEEYSKLLESIVGNNSILKQNKHLPIIIVNSDNGVEYGAFTYMDKIVQLTETECHCLIDINEKEIDGDKLVKMLVLALPINLKNSTTTSNLSFFIIPELCENNLKCPEDMLELCSEIIVIDNEKKTFSQKFDFIENKVFFVEKDAEKINDENTYSYHAFDEHVGSFNKPSLNYMTTQVFESILCEALMATKQELDKTNEFIEMANEDTLDTDDVKVKKSVTGRKKNSIYLHNELEKNLKKIKNYLKDLQSDTAAYEKLLLDNANSGNSPEEYSDERYVELLEDLFLKYVFIQDNSKAKRLLKKLEKENLPEFECLELYFKVAQGIEVPKSNVISAVSKLNVKNIATAKLVVNLIVLVDEKYIESIKIEDLIRYAFLLREPKTWAEYYLFGCVAEIETDYSKSAELYKEAYLGGIWGAADRLLALNEKYEKESGLDLEALADLLIPEANRGLYYTYEDKNNKDYADFQLKLAAASGYDQAICDFACYKHIEWSEEGMPKNNDNRIKVLIAVTNKALETDILNDADIAMFKENLGYLYLAQEHYRDAYKLFKESKTPYGFFECGVMNQDGLGRSINLEEAKKCYRKIEKINEINGAKERYDEVCREIEQKKEEARRRKEELERARHSDHSDYYDDSFCFITTATCRALRTGPNCAELMNLRKFRDEYMLDGGENSTLVDEYYKVAPEIVKCINNDPDSYNIYSDIWKSFIQPCCENIEYGKLEEGKIGYIDMMRFLCKKYDISVKADIKKRYYFN